MIQATILAIGGIKDAPLRELAEEYLKRLAPYAKVEIQELKAEAFGADDEEKAKKKEGERILNFLEKKSDVKIFLLTESGKLKNSKEFAGFLGAESGQIIFVIAGALGFSDEVLKKPFVRLSLSPMTFTHEMARVILLEQIYRAATILKGKKYHY